MSAILLWLLVIVFLSWIFESDFLEELRSELIGVIVDMVHICGVVGLAIDCLGKGQSRLEERLPLLFGASGVLL